MFAMPRTASSLFHSYRCESGSPVCDSEDTTGFQSINDAYPVRHLWAQNALIVTLPVTTLAHRNCNHSAVLSCSPVLGGCTRGQAAALEKERRSAELAPGAAAVQPQ